MEKQDLQTTINVKVPVHEALKAITNIPAWWMEDFEGRTTALDDVFTIQFRPGAFVTAQIVELVPDRKVTWLVTDCNLSWLKDNKEWKDTRMVFEIKKNGDGTRIRFTHSGIGPVKECYHDCVKGWDHYIKESLHGLLTEGIGRPAKRQSQQ